MSALSMRTRQLVAVLVICIAALMIPSVASAGPTCVHDAHAHWHNGGFFAYGYKGYSNIVGGQYVYHIHRYSQKVLIIGGGWVPLADTTRTCTPLH